jgi:lipopolysaccharide transport system ATP-binding protein
MPSSVIKVNNLSKKYTLGQTHTNLLSERIGNGLRRMFRRNNSTVQHLNNSTDQKEFWALKDVSFEVNQGEVLGIIGRNGAGKSTLLKILSRITSPTSGKVEIFGRVGSLLEVGTGFHPELTGRENIFLNGAILGMSKTEITRKRDEIIAFAEVEKFIDTPVKRYSSGMYVRLAFAVAAHLEPEILVVDEVLAVGDTEFQKKCLGKMEEVSESGRTVIFVSHNMESIQKLCSMALHIDKGEVKDFGKAQDIIEKYLSQFHHNEDSSIIPFLTGTNSAYYIEKVEILNLDGTAKERVYTWDAVRFRIHFYSPKELKSGSIVLQFSTLSGVVISLCSTQPDQTVNMQFKEGSNQIDCIFPQLMLSAGEYIIGAGLAIPNIEWLYKEFDQKVLRIFPRDIYESGMAPKSSRYIVPQQYRWELLD